MRLRRISTARRHCGGDYNKGVVTQELLRACAHCGHADLVELELKPSYQLDISGLSLITPNRGELFELAGLTDETRHPNPSVRCNVRGESRAGAYKPALFGDLEEQGMLLAQRGASRS